MNIFKKIIMSMDEGFGKEIGRKYTKGNQFRAFETAKTVLKRLFNLNNF